VPVAVACRVLELSTQGYYKWLKSPVSQRDWDDAHLIDAALRIHRDDPGYGYRFIADELAELGYPVSENRIWRMCSAQGIFSVHAKKRGRNRKPGPPVHDDLLAFIDEHGRARHDFSATAPNQKCLSYSFPHKPHCCDDRWNPSRFQIRDVANESCAWFTGREVTINEITRINITVSMSRGDPKSSWLHGF